MQHNDIIIQKATSIIQPSIVQQNYDQGYMSYRLHLRAHKPLFPGSISISKLSYSQVVASMVQPFATILHQDQRESACVRDRYLGSSQASVLPWYAMQGIIIKNCLSVLAVSTLSTV